MCYARLLERRPALARLFNPADESGRGLSTPAIVKALRLR
jgi:hypothetical protein